MYHGLMTIEQAERARVFARTDIGRGKFYFNYIYTGLGYPGFKKFLGLKEKSRTSREPVPKSKIKNLGKLCEWLYGNAQRNIEPLIRSQNPDLKTLDNVLMEEKGVSALRDGLSLDIAYDISLGDEPLFRTALHDAKRSLQKAHATLTTGYLPRPGGDELQTANDVQDLAVDLVQGILEKKRKRQRAVHQEHSKNA